jgi:hypothetical protein
MNGIPTPTVIAAGSELWTAVEGTPYRSIDRGAQWKPRRAIPAADGSADPGASIRKLAFDDLGVLLYAQVDYLDRTVLWQSGDNATFWGLLAPPQIPSAPPNAERFAIAPSATLYALSVDAGLMTQIVYRSTHNGNPWQPEGDTGLLCGVGDLAVAPSNPEVLYAGGSGKSPAPYLCRPPFTPRVVRSDDGGATWTDVTAGLPGDFVAALAIDPRDARTVYAGLGPGAAFPDGDGVWKSTDGGATWARVGGELAGHSITVLLASALPGRIYAVVDGDRVVRSDDGGASWQGWSRNLRDTAILALAADPYDPSRIYAATANGVWTLTETD